jgi:hypothetical protein
VNTPAHLIFAAAAFARPADRPLEAAETRRRNLAALLGALAPDMSVYLLVAWSRLALGRSWGEVFGRDYGSPLWQSVFAVDNSLPLWGAVTGVALWRRWPLLSVFGAAGLLHLAFDLPLHHSDARPHLWPLTDWVFRSPVSYWNPARHGEIASLAEGAACAVLALLLWRRFRGARARALILAALAAQLSPIVIRPLLLS